MTTYAYVYNSYNSNCNLLMESTNWSCLGAYNGVYTVCYTTPEGGIAPGQGVKFPVQPTGDNGLHAQPAPAGSKPTGVWDLQTGTVFINTTTGKVSFTPGSPSAAAAKTDRKPPVPAVRPKKQSKKKHKDDKSAES